MLGFEAYLLPQMTGENPKPVINKENMRAMAYKSTI